MKRATLLALLALAAACQTNPITGRSQFKLFSEETMTGMGVDAYAEMTDPAAVNVSTDGRLTAPLLRVGAAISRAAERLDYEWEFKLIDDRETVNAWALPGGKIAFYTGIYPILQDEAGMAIVMGHEVMHALLGHGNERMSQTLTTQVVLAAADIGLQNSEHHDEIMAGLGLGATVGILLPYSRSHESESDRYGLMLAAKAGYDPRAAIQVWERMAALSEGERPPEFLSTHPDPRNRIENMKQWMGEALRLYEQAPNKPPNRRLPAVK